MGVIEMVEFRVKPGVSEEAFFESSEQAQRFLERQPGYLARELARTEDGGWLDTVRWTDIASAKRAAELFPAEPFAQAMIAILEQEGMRMIHAEAVRSWPAARG